ncbi:MAG: hypothetical protein QW763_01240 [Archaeoglobaceae archaeon]
MGNPDKDAKKYDYVGFPCSICGETEFKIILKGETFYRYICPKCKTPTYIFISKNLDILMLREDELCPECHGTGKCSKCNGTGQVKCPKCGGLGYYKEYQYYYGCYMCGGLHKTNFKPYEEEFYKSIKKGGGLVKCDTCNGTGVCSSCGGFRMGRKQLKYGQERVEIR